ncbi:hypothetical protein HNR65_000362 [Desulfosalsimonas propionicica]|uniref:DUF2007 domain-containing protein n=1 Tax=Desulfosalsimonas propionicica TaxID=332175 RepID=A0A7W0HJC8_9BACT|nr:hypothetical protein [Desulfosalsimonas propionicica]MBA2880055.1 hypothetical protein [Desulfosalsimonas propionicica]
MDAQDPRHAEYKHVSALENPFEAQLLESILRERQIPHCMRSHHDTAYDGLFQMQKGWGEVFAPEPQHGPILEILEQIRQEGQNSKHPDSER